MAETIAAFQSQLSGVMETVFKAAMYEITRLVEDSFLEDITRCKEQVDTLKRRLKLSESRRKQREADHNNQGCVNCRRVELSDEKPQATAVQTDTSVKHENGEFEYVNSPQATDGERQEVKASPKAAQSPCAQSKRLNRGKDSKSPDLQVYPDLNEKGNSSDEESNVPGSSNHLSDSKYHLNWEARFGHKTESEQNCGTDNSTDPLFENRYDEDNLDNFNNIGYEATNMTHISDRESLVQFEDGAKSGERADQQTYHKDNSGTWSPPRTQEMDVSGEYDCMLINEEGDLQDPSIIYPDHIDSGSHHNVRDQTNNTGNMTLDGTEYMYGESNAISDITHVVDMLQHQSMGKGGRRHACNFCLATFSDSASLKAHKQTHRRDSDGGLPYLCNQRRKTAARVYNLEVYEKNHSGQEPQLCRHCGESFPTIFELQKHKCTQRGDKPYCCQVCGNKFSRLWNLKLHQRIHTQEKPHHCSMCDKSFTRADILKVHLRTHTGERPYCCLVCGLTFKRLDHLKSHQRKHMTDQ